MMNISAATSARTSAHVNAPASAEDVPLEPKSALPEPAPFKAGVGTWIGTGFGALGGGVVGATAGALAVGFMSSNVGEGFLSGAGMGTWAGAAIGLGIGGFLAYRSLKSSHENAEHDRIQASFGSSTLQLSKDRIARFDHDHDGSIDLVNTTGLASQDERALTEAQQQSREERHYDHFNDEWDTDTVTWTEHRGISAAPIWDAANVAPKDDTVTESELARLMSRFDADASGALTTSEQQAFDTAHPLIVEPWSS